MLCFEIIQVHVIRDFTKKLRLIESFLAARHSISRTLRCRGASRILPNIEDGTCEISCGRYSSSKFHIVLNMTEFA